MPWKTSLTQQIAKHPLRFLWRILRRFQTNQGLLLSGAVAYYMLLSIIPLFILLLIGLSHVVNETQVLAILTHYLELLVPGESGPLLEQVKIFLEHRQALGWFLVGVLLFFSSLAFSILESAISVIFFHRVKIRRRPFFISALLPYLFIVLLASGLLTITLIIGLLQAAENFSLMVFGWEISLGGMAGLVFYWLGLLSELLMVAAIYWLMPVGNLPWRHALLGGLTAVLLWEPTRHLLIWYFAHLSLVNVIYGSLGTTIIALLTLEIGSMILLLGAQVIAEYERIKQEIETESVRDYPAEPPT
ncbi:MAG TPA: YihY/virulence factor BrkB family protein [Candidatus Competibacteraceae bacterium]|nr:YihY/virulence factor BrkB family protein [Candidatus Competibacteraceae bacterium]